MSAVSDIAKQHAEKIRYLVVGIWNTVFGVGLYNLLLTFAGPPLAHLAGSANPLLDFMGANNYNVIFWLGWVLSVPQSTITMKYFVFRSRGHLGHEVFRAYFVYLPAQGLSSLMMWLLVGIAGLNPRIAQLITIFITVIFSYLGHKYFTFGGKQRGGKGSDGGRQPDAGLAVVEGERSASDRH